MGSAVMPPSRLADTVNFAKVDLDPSASQKLAARSDAQFTMRLTVK